MTTTATVVDDEPLQNVTMGVNTIGSGPHPKVYVLASGVGAGGAGAVQAMSLWKTVKVAAPLVHVYLCDGFVPMHVFTG